VALTDLANLKMRVGEPGTTYFTDDQYTQFLADQDDNILQAAADVCLAMATDRALVNLLIRQGNYTRDARGVARELRRMAGEYRAAASTTPAIAIGDANEPFSSILGVTG